MAAEHQNGYKLVRLQPKQVLKAGDTMTGNLVMTNGGKFVGDLTGNADTTTKLQTSRNINGTAFDGTRSITTTQWGTARNINIASSDGSGAGTNTSINGSTNYTLRLPATIKANLTGNVTGNLNGNASTADKLKNPINITIGNSQNQFDGSGNINITLDQMGVSDKNHTHNVYLPLAGGNMTGTINNNMTTNTYLAGNQGRALVNSTAGAGLYTTLLKSNSQNGYFTLSNYQQSLFLYYTAKTTVDAGNNQTTHGVTLLNESGNTSFPGTVTARSFSGNATTATRLATARSITVGNTTRTFDGSGNITFSLADIGAAGSSKPPSAGDWWSGGSATVNTDGVMEVGKYIDFHNSDTTRNDYSTRLQINSDTQNVITLPSASGTVSLEGHTHNYAATNHTHGNYLPTSGGTLSGGLTVNAKVAASSLSIGGRNITISANAPAQITGDIWIQI